VTARNLYQDVAFVAGMILIFVGAVNCIIGIKESNKYQRVIARISQTGLEESYRNFRELSPRSNEQVLSRMSEEQERYNIARVRLDFFQVVVSGGQLFLLIGALITAYSVIRVIRRDAALQIQKISRAKSPPPGKPRETSVDDRQ
jgi:hypothetical protein